MKKNTILQFAAGSVLGIFGAVLGFVSLHHVLAVPTAAPPNGNPTFPLEGPTGPTGPQGQQGAQGVQGATGAPGMATVMAIHSQTLTVPTCPSGWTTLWTGFSFLGGKLDDGFGAVQDPGSPGSCLDGTQYSTSPILECFGVNTCQVNTSGDYSYWLSATSDSGSGGQSSDLNTCFNYDISRCAVCEKHATVVVRHSHSGSVPSCPSGYISLWSGWTLEGFWGDPGEGTRVDMGGPGSCMRVFRGDPLIETNNNSNCNYVTSGDAGMWLQSALTAAPGRCNVCEKT